MIMIIHNGALDIIFGRNSMKKIVNYQYLERKKN